MSTRNHRRWTAEEKLSILEEARQSGQSISEVCRRHQIAAGQFYAWERQARQGALTALKNNKPGRRSADPTETLQAQILRLQAVVAEITAENLDLKRGSWPKSVLHG
jgi:transposase-like protein